MSFPNQENIYKDFKINEDQLCKKSKCANHFISVGQPKSCCYGCTLTKKLYEKCRGSNFTKYFALETVKLESKLESRKISRTTTAQGERL